MAKAFVYFANNTSQTITGGGAVNPGTAQHGFGCTCGEKTISLNGTNINLGASGYYSIDIGATVTDASAGNVTLALYQDGTPIASGTEAIATANDPASISFPAGALVKCNSTLTIVATATAGDPVITNIYTVVERV